jgi:hypothetical protein
MGIEVMGKIFLNFKNIGREGTLPVLDYKGEGNN